MSRFAIIVAILIAITFFVVWTAGSSLTVPETTSGTASLTYNIVLVVMLLASLVLGWRGTASQALRYAMMYLSLFFVLILGYSYRHDFSYAWQRVSGELNPARPISKSGNEVALRRSIDGHFYVEASINGSDMRLLADTGASVIALSVEDAESAGIDVDQLNFNLRVSTANGQAVAARVTIDEVRVGSIVRNDVSALVGRGLGASLLGMSFFNTLSKFEIENDELVLRD